MQTVQYNERVIYNEIYNICMCNIYLMASAELQPAQVFCQKLQPGGNVKFKDPSALVVSFSPLSAFQS